MPPESRSESIPTPATLALVWLGLMLLLALTAGSAWLALGRLNIVINLGISFAKTLLVTAFFMHLRERGGLLRTVAAAGLVWLSLLLALSLADYLTRTGMAPPW
jgi:cytochrome c oxidase subunit IV